MVEAEIIVPFFIQLSIGSIQVDRYACVIDIKNVIPDGELVG